MSEPAEVITHGVSERVEFDGGVDSRAAADGRAGRVSNRDGAVHFLDNDPVGPTPIRVVSLMGPVHVGVAAHPTTIADVYRRVDTTECVDDVVMIRVSHLDTSHHLSTEVILAQFGG
jgi:hypothetical protein